MRSSTAGPWDAPAESREAGGGFQEINHQQVSEELMKGTRKNGLNICPDREPYAHFPSVPVK